MNKFFRRFGRPLLMVFMALLLVVWLIPQSSNRQERQGNPKEQVGHAFGQPIYQGDLERAHADAQILQRLLGRQLPPIDVLDLYLLVQEAKQMGVRVGREHAKAVLQGINAADLAAVQNDYHRSLDSIYDTVGDWLAVMMATRLQMEALGESLPRMELAYRDEMQEATVLLSVIDAKAFLPLVGEPTDDDLKAMFEESKSRTEAHTEEKLQFGYLQPQRVRVEYLTIDPDQVRKSQKFQVRDAEVRRFYEENKAHYVKRVPRPAVSTQPGQQPQFDVIQMTFAEVEKQAKEDCRTEKAIRESQSLVNEIEREARKPWDAAALGEDNYRVSPPKESLVSFEALRDKYSAQYPVILKKTDLLDADGLRREPGIGQAFGTDENARVGFAQLAMRVKGLFKAEPNDPLPVLNIDEPGPVLLNMRPDPVTRTQRRPYQAYVFRVTEAVSSGPPESWEKVRAKLAEDWRLKKAQAMAQTYALKLAERAKEVGLTAAVAENQELKELLAKADPQPPTQPATTRPVEPGPYVQALGPFSPSGRFTRPPEQANQFSRSVTPIRHVGISRRLPKEVFALLDAPPISSAPAHRVVLVELANIQKWVVAELESVKPLYAGEFQKELAQLEQEGQRNQWMVFGQNWYTPENIRQRTNFVPRQAAQ